MDELTKAGLAMAAELENEWGWSVGDHDTAADEFAALAVKHFAPLTDYAAFRVMRIDALTAEIAALEAAGDERPNVLGEGPPERRSRGGNPKAQLWGGPSRPEC